MRPQVNQDFQFTYKGFHGSRVIDLRFNHFNSHRFNSFFRILDANSFRLDNPAETPNSQLHPWIVIQYKAFKISL